MAELQDHNDQNTCGIKLFGATIAIEERKTRNDQDKSQEILEKRQALDKIIPCPRCKSMKTKFCYFNNYNINQPRHYCKGCQRYWTAGGALRNVPVGAGRRKSKPTCHGLDGDLSDGCMSDCAPHQVEVQQRELADGVGEEWHEAEHGGFRDVFPAKRRRNETNSQPC